MFPLILAPLLTQGLNLLANAVMKKGEAFVENATGIKLKETMSDEELTILRQYEMEHEEELLKLQVEDNQISLELEKARLADIDSARNMQKTALQSGNSYAVSFLNSFSIFWCLVGCTYIGFVTFGSVPVENTRFADTILGFILGSIISPILAFYYGSSKSSQAKDATISKAVTSLGEMQ